MSRFRRWRTGRGPVLGLGLLVGIFAWQAPSLWAEPVHPPARPAQAVAGAAGPGAPGRQRIGATAAVRVIDGDTIDVDGVRIRIAGIDTPETRPARCRYEAELGARATRRLEALLDEGDFELVPVGRDEDRYGRKLRDIVRDGVSLGDVLVAEGLARPYGSGRRPWCA